MKKFDIDKFQEKVIEHVTKLLDEVPEEWKAEMAGFISIQAVIYGADNIYEGIGIFELTKQEYIEICNEVLSEDEISTGLN